VAFIIDRSLVARAFARHLAAGAIVTVLATGAADAIAAGHSLRFDGAGTGDIDRVKIRVDDPLTALPGPPADVGAGDFTLEFWLMATAAQNTAGAVTCGANQAWTAGNVVVDRDRLGADRKFGVAIAGGKVIFGVSGDATGDLTLCSLSSVLDGAWHHVAVERRRSDGFLWLFVDGNLEAQATGPGGDISYPDAAAPAHVNDPYLVFGAEKFDTGKAYSGWLDEIRISTKLRYMASFPRPRAPFVADRFTAALYHCDDGSGTTLHDVAGATGGPNDGQIKRGGAANGPAWMPESPFNVGGLVSNATIAFTPYVSGLGLPVEIVNAGDGSGRLYVVQQGGSIRVIRNGTLLTTPFINLSAKVACCGEEGLLGLAFHPKYAQNGFFYVYYTRTGDGALTIERYQRSADNTNVADPASVKPMLVIPHPGQSNHNGGKMAFGRDGYLYIGTGDGGSGNDPPNNAQTLSRRLGKMLRLDVDQNINTSPYYGIPPSNPFALNACDGVDVGICPEIWALGLRNPWRWTFDRLTGDQIIADVGQSAREEVDFDPWPLTPGRNYGWRIMEGNICTPGVNPSCTPPANYAAPVFDYPHPPGIAVIGGYMYRGDLIPALHGTYIYADEGANLLWAATRADSGAWTSQLQLLATPTSISAFGEDEVGELYAAGLGNGIIYKITPIDSEADGMPDWWELAYFGSVTGAAAGADPDGDGATNLQEYRARTDPLSAASKPSTAPTKASVAIWRPSQARWHVDTDFDQAADQKVYFGVSTDTPLAGRIDPGRTYDFVVYRNGLWYASTTHDGNADFSAVFGGLPGDVPLLADFNGDGRDDLVIYRDGLWFVSTAQNGVAAMTFAFGGVAQRPGVPGDIPLAGDVNGDGIADLAIYRNGIWYIDTNRNGIADITVAFGGLPGDIPLLFDFDGDGKADLCIVRNGVWYVNTKLDGTAQAIWSYGVGTDIPFAWKE
jgi:glucose/arabinose dehydrogenase